MSKITNYFKELNLFKKIKNFKYYFALTIGDNGAILTYFRGTKLELRQYFEQPTEENIAALIKIIREDPKTTLYVIIDNADQTYNQHSLPGVSSYAIKNLVKRRLEREFPKGNLNGSLNLGRTKDGRKDWNYLFISTPYEGNIAKWIESISDSPNIIQGILLMPVEKAHVLSEINRYLYPNNNPKSLQMLITYNSISGIRQTVFRDNKIMFTRLLTDFDKDAYPDVIAGYIEQETANIIQFVHRNSKDNEPCDIIAIVPPDIQKYLFVSNKFANTYCYSPQEFAQKIGFKNAVQNSDKYADVLMAMCIDYSNPRLILHNNKTQNLLKYSYAIEYSRYGIYVCSIILVVKILLYAYEYINLYSTSNNNEDNINKLQANISKMKQESGLDKQDAAVIQQVVNFYKIINKSSANPFDIIEKFVDMVNNDSMIITYLDWQVETDPPGIANKIKSKPTTKSEFRVKFLKNNSSFQNLFQSFDEFIGALEKKFNNYTVEYTRINQQINFQDSIQEVPVNIKIRGPNE